MTDKLNREELYSPLKSKGFLHEWARDIMNTFPAINEIMTESKLRELGVQLLMKQKNSEAIMTVKQFDSLKSRDFENGAVINEIRSALKERESLLTPVPKHKIRELVEKWARIMETHNDLWSTEDRVKDLLKEYDNLREGKEG